MLHRIFVSVALVGLMVSTAAAAESGAAERTDALIAAFKAVKPMPETGELTAADKQANVKAFADLDGFFDYDRLTGDPIEPHKKSLGAAQQRRFREAFRELIRLVAFPNSGTFLSAAKTTVKPAQVNGTSAEVAMHTALPKEDVEIDVLFHWKKSAGAWRIVDVAFDGASLVKDYQNQFGRIITKKGGDGLMDTLEKRLTKERSERKVLP
mgnify:CR=1 FL=1